MDKLAKIVANSYLLLVLIGMLTVPFGVIPIIGVKNNSVLSIQDQRPENKQPTIDTVKEPVQVLEDETEPTVETTESSNSITEELIY